MGLVGERSLIGESEQPTYVWLPPLPHTSLSCPYAVIACIIIITLISQVLTGKLQEISLVVGKVPDEFL